MAWAGNPGAPQGGWPSNIMDIWNQVRDYSSRPGAPGSLTPGQQQFHQQWSPFTPPIGAALSPELQGIINFNVGPQVASAPLSPEGIASPSAPLAGWQPAQEEYT